MARRTRSRVSGATFGCPLTTRDTVWCETPARAATSDMPSARCGPSGSTAPPFTGAASLPPPVDGPAGPSARRACAPLVVDVERHGQQQHEPLDDRLDRLVDAHELHAVAHHGHDEATDHGPDDGAHTTGDGGATDEGRRDGV